MLRRLFVLAALCICVAALTALACPVRAQADTNSGAPETTTNAAYQLGPGDKLKISIFGQTDWNGEYAVDGAGNVQLPLIGQIKAAGLTISQFQKVITDKLSDGYYVNPSVSIEVTNYRPFYIIGQVSKPGEYAYVNDMSILNAVALAGGYTSRADESEAYIRRNGATKEIQVPADETTKVQPGDIIRIPERYF